MLSPLQRRAVTLLAAYTIRAHSTRSLWRCCSSVRMYSHATTTSSVGLASSQSRIGAVAGGGGVQTTPSQPPSSSIFTGRGAGARFWPASLSTPAASGATGSSSLTQQVSGTSDSSLTRRFSSVIAQQVSEYAREPQKSLTLKQLLAVGPNPSKEALLASARFLHRELPIRLAKRVKELESLPYGLSQLAPVQKVRFWYEESFKEILSTPEPHTEEEELAFTKLLEAIHERHTNVTPTLAQGVLLMKQELGASGNDVLNQCPFLQDFLNRFHSSRIGIRLLISQHLAIHHPVPGYIGTIATSISPVSVIRDAISDAARICDRVYGWAPEVDIIGATDSFKIDFVPTHLHHICFELIKNSMRAVLEHHGVKNYDAPSIQVVLSEDEREFAIKISDQGGGIPRKDMPRIWSYLYTTQSSDVAQSLIDGGGGVIGASAEGHPTNAVGPNGDGGTPMSGFGYGLPISRLHLRFWGGDLDLVSVEGYGSDAYMFLPKNAEMNDAAS